ncbi:TPA: hypothetical protein NJY08_005047, partial [Salmonella enterica subsp. enterica serovar Typhi str. AG3]|nr:hypothetical protein [Salmonella enterica subsp. enterica serovar Typhi str. AG3]
MKNHTVIIAEKKDAAYNFAKALSLHVKQHDGYLEDEVQQYYYTWAQGHLLQIDDPGSMNEEWKEWKWDNMPIIPSAISLKPLPDATKQLNVISKLTRNCKLIVNAFDPSPSGSGDLIYLYIQLWLKLTNIPTKRLWTASLQPSAIKEAYANMKDNSEYKDLQNMAISRALGDYVCGINFSRSITLLGNNKQSFSIGRVILVCLGLLYDREIQRDSFVPETYFKVKGVFGQGEQKFKA